MTRLLSLTMLLAVGALLAPAQKIQLSCPITGLDYAKTVAFSKDGQYVVSAYEDEFESTDRFVVWDRASGIAIYTLSRLGAATPEAIFSPDSRNVILKFNDKVECWDIKKQIMIWSKNGYDHISEYNNECILLSGSRDGQEFLSLTRCNTGDSAGDLDLDEVEANAIERPEVSNTGKFLAIRGNADMSSSVLSIYATQDHSKLYSIVVGKGEKNYRFSKDDRYLICSYHTGLVAVFNAQTGDTAFAHMFPTAAKVAALSYNDSVLAVILGYGGSSYGTLDIVDCSNGKVLQDMPLNTSVSDIFFCHNDSAILVKMDTIKYFDRHELRWHTVGAFEDEQGQPMGQFSSDSRVYIVKLRTGSLAMLDANSIAPGKEFFAIAAPVLRSRATDNTHFITWADRAIKGATPAWLEFSDSWTGYEFEQQLIKWDASTGQKKFIGPVDGISTTKIEVSFDGRYILTGPTGNQQEIYDSHAGQKLSSFTIDSNSVYTSVFFSKDGSTMLYTCEAREKDPIRYSVEARNVHTGKLILSIPTKHGNSIEGISDDGSFGLLSLDVDNVYKLGCRLLDLRTGRTIFSAADIAFPWTFPLTYSSTVTHDDEIGIFHHRSFYALQNGRLHKFSIIGNSVQSIYQLPRYAAGDTQRIQKGWLPDESGSFLFTQNEDHLYLWNAGTGRLLDSLVFPGRLDQFRFSPDGSFIFLLGMADKQIVSCKWDPRTFGRQIRISKNPLEYLGGDILINSLSLSSDHRLAIFGSTDRFLMVYDLEKEKILYQLIPIGLHNFIVFDPENSYYSSSSSARSLLYVNQDNDVKPYGSDTHYVPDLIRKIMQ